MSSPYNYIPYETGYSFTTDSGKQYIISFLTCSEYLFGTDIYGLVRLVDFSFFVQKKSNLGVSYDPRIAPTIIDILDQLFDVNPEYAVIVTYDSTDGRHLVRKRKFDSWYRRYIPSHSIEKYDAYSGSDRLQYIHSLFIRTDNPYRYKILTELNEFIQVLNLSK